MSTERSPRSAESAADATLERVLQLTGPRETAAAERVARVRSAVHEEWRRAVRVRHRRRWFLVGGTGLAAAATLVLFVVPRQSPRIEAPARIPDAARVRSAGVGVTVTGSGTPLREGQVLEAGSGFSTPHGRYASLELAGGGDVRIDGGTTVAVLDDRRIALTHGAIYVDVASGAGASLTVETRDGIVRDIGTRFEVRVSDRGSRIRVREGAVRLDRGASRHDAAAGTQLFVPVQGPVESAPITEYDSGWTWTVLAAPSFPVEGRTLQAFLEWVSREGGRRVVFLDPMVERRLQGTVLHGSVDGLSVDQALSVILPTCGLTHRVDGPRVLIGWSGPGGSR
jgi:ferric-dicitrate binding protein FerR (iron transport regulator)